MAVEGRRAALGWGHQGPKPGDLEPCSLCCSRPTHSPELWSETLSCKAHSFSCNARLREDSNFLWPPRPLQGCQLNCSQLSRLPASGRHLLPGMGKAAASALGVSQATTLVRTQLRLEANSGNPLEFSMGPGYWGSLCTLSLKLCCLSQGSLRHRNPLQGKNRGPKSTASCSHAFQ